MFGFAAEVEGREILGARDVFIRSLGGFERGVRMGRDAEEEEEVFLAFAAGCVREWPRELADHVGKALEGVAGKLAPFARLLPAEIRLVHNTGHEEAGSGYTRGRSIVLPPGKAGYPVERLERFVTHECFHLLTRFNPRVRDRLYALLGFRPCGSVVLPERFERWRITNPDAPLREHAITTLLDGQERILLPALHWAEPRFLAGRYFEHVRMSLLAIHETAAGWSVVPGSSAVPRETLEGVFLARNLAFDQPEEMLAELFVQLVHGETKAPPALVGAMGRLLAE